MKINKFKGLAFLIVLALIIPAALQFTAPAVAEASKNEGHQKSRKVKHDASFNKKKATLNGFGTTSQIDIKYLADGTVCTWSSSNNNVATVNSNGLVTSISDGNTIIKCKIKSHGKKASVLSCHINVKGTRAEVSITNEKKNKGVQRIALGTIYDFDAIIKPIGTSSTISWTIKDTSIATVNADGVVTPLKEGTTILTASAVSGSAVSVSGCAIGFKGIKSDKVVIKVTSANVCEAKLIKMTSDKTIVINFTDSIIGETVLDQSVLKNAITITPIVNASGVSAANPGELKGVLSDDNKTLTIIATNYFYGFYDVKLTNQIKSANGLVLKDYQQRMLLIFVQ